MYDAVIIGGGPAGLSAALNLKLHALDFLWFGSLSEKVEKAEKIANYPGACMLSGQELNESFQKQITEMALPLSPKRVTNILRTRKGYTLLADNEMAETRTVLLAIGAAAAKGFPGEEELLGRGVSYCATCDGFLCAGKDVAVYCASPRYEHEVEYLAGIANKVYLQTGYPDVSVKKQNVEMLSSPIARVQGAERVTGLKLKNGQEIAVDGLFCLRSAIAPEVLLPGLAMEGAHIAADRQCRCNLPGCFAAGDCTGRPYQIAKAVGEGNIAAHSILEYLSQSEKTE